MSDLPSYIGRYRIVDLLGGGGMGLVYVARDPAINRTVVIKVTRANDAAFRRRFLREARAAGCLNHDAIVTIFDAGECEGKPFIVMEYVEGRTVGQIIKQVEEWPLGRRLRLMRELCDGLAYAHARGIVHRDVKPDNLMVRDANGRLAILDFGIARIAGAETTTSGFEGDQTSAGQMIGTPHYMAPEQIQSQPVDHRCDIFSAGAVFYELLSYRRAFSADTVTGVIYKILHADPMPLAQLDARLDPALIDIVERAIAKVPDERYQDMREVIADLDAVIFEIEGGGETKIPRSSTPRRDIEDQPAVEASSTADAVSHPGPGQADRSKPMGTRITRRRARGLDRFLGQRPVVTPVAVALAGVLLVGGGLWLAFSSGEGPDAPPGSDPASNMSSTARPNPGAADTAAADADGDAKGREEAPVAGPAPERSIEELLAEANRAFQEGRYDTARRLFSEVYERSGGQQPTQVDGPVPTEPAGADRPR